jgi:hypothetical protein
MRWQRVDEFRHGYRGPDLISDQLEDRVAL